LIIDTERQKLNKECFENQEKLTEVFEINRSISSGLSADLKKGLQEKTVRYQIAVILRHAKNCAAYRGGPGKDFAGLNPNSGQRPR